MTRGVQHCSMVLYLTNSRIPHTVVSCFLFRAAAFNCFVVRFTKQGSSIRLLVKPDLTYNSNGAAWRARTRRGARATTVTPPTAAAGREWARRQGPRGPRPRAGSAGSGIGPPFAEAPVLPMRACPSPPGDFLLPAAEAAKAELNSQARVTLRAVLGLGRCWYNQ